MAGRTRDVIPGRTAAADVRRLAPIDDEFTARPGVWVGAKVGLFALSRPGTTARGAADWDWLRVEAAGQ